MSSVCGVAGLAYSVLLLIVCVAVQGSPQVLLAIPRPDKVIWLVSTNCQGAGGEGGAL